MVHSNHLFHIPVMGTGHSIDSPIRVAHLGIDSCISVVDDILCEKIRKYYSELFDLPFQNIPRSAEDGRALRITAYLDTVNEIVQKKFNELKTLSILTNSEKDQYFKLLPDTSVLRQVYDSLPGLKEMNLFMDKVNELTEMMVMGSIDVNIMSKVDALRVSKNTGDKDPIYSDANTALRGYANSKLNSALVLSAGFNPRLYGYLSEFNDFYRDEAGEIKKRLILKVSDFRSALIQGKFLAKKGLEIEESDLPDLDKDIAKERVIEKSCLCVNLGSGALIRLGLEKPSYGRQEICPGPNIAWFNRRYSLQEMVDHIYGRSESLVPKERPHMFAKEIELYVDYLKTMLEVTDTDSSEFGKLNRMRKNLDEGMEECLKISELDPYQDENLESIRSTVEIQKSRLNELFSVIA